MAEDKIKQMKDMLLQSLYDYHHANDGGSYTLPKSMLNTDVNSKVAIEELIQEEYAIDGGEGTDNLILSITPKGITYIENEK